MIATNMAFAADGRIFLADKAGVIRVVQNGALLPTAFIDISADVNNYFEHGLTGLVLDPQFPTRPYLYVFYVYDAPGQNKDVAGQRILRFVAADPTNTSVAATSNARTVRMGANATSSTLGCLSGGVPVQDCLPIDSSRRATGDLRFGTDGRL